MNGDHVEPLNQGECSHEFYLVTVTTENEHTVDQTRALRCANCGYTRPVPEPSDMEFYGMGACTSCKRDFAIYTPRNVDRVLIAGTLCPMCARERSKR